MEPRKQKTPKPARRPWSEYYERTRSVGASLSLIEALKNVEHKDAALDLGSGSGRDSLFLLDQGFGHVVAVDAEAGAADVLNHVPEAKRDDLEFVQARFDEFEYGDARYDLINAQFALPFNPPETFDEMFSRLKQSLKPSGVFVGTFFGENDEWNTSVSKQTFHSRAEVEALLSGLEIIKLEEEDNPDGRLADGTPKHWHRFIVIARRPPKQ